MIINRIATYMQCLIIVLLVSWSLPAFGQSVTVLFTANLNGMLDSCHCPHDLQGGIIRLYTAIQTERKFCPDLLLVDSGDFMAYRDPVKNDFMAQAVKKLQFSAMTLGEQDILAKPDLYKWKSINPPVYTSLIPASRNQQLLPNSRIISRAGIRIVIISLMDADAFSLLPAALQARLKLPDPFLLAQQLLTGFEGKVDMVLVISHMSETNNLKLAAQLPKNSIIIAGHNQVLLKAPNHVGNTLIVQPGKDGLYLGKLTIKRSTHSDFIVSHHMIPITTRVPEHPMIRTLLNHYFSALKRENSTQQDDPKSKLTITLFASPRCGYCHALMAQLQKRHPEYKIELIDIDQTAGYRHYMAQHPKSTRLPMVQINTIQLCGKDEISKQLFKLLDSR